MGKKMVKHRVKRKEEEEKRRRQRKEDEVGRRK